MEVDVDATIWSTKIEGLAPNNKSIWKSMLILQLNQQQKQKA
jgi:hypothetical protein